ncbi:MAG TPA: hypothetical protein VJ880_06545, partial [Allomuricauda sp.]|nr:hypothetical protein [Allomuricauda sp.]
MKLFFKPIIVCFTLLLLACSSDDNGNGDIVDEDDGIVGETPIETLATLSPANNESPVSKTPTISWENYVSDQAITYSLLLGTSENTMTEIDSGLTTTTYDIVESSSLDLNTEYFWQIIAYKDDETVAESEIQTFTTELIFPSLITEDAAYGARKAAGVEVFDDKIWVIGGLNEADVALTDIWSSDDGENWTLEGNFPFSGIYGHELIVFNGKLWIYGGVSEGFLSTKIFSSEDGIAWVEETETAPFIQYQFSKFEVLGDKIFRIAGYSGDIDDLSPERNVYSSIDGLNWNLEIENHGFDTKYSFQIENLNETLYSFEPNADLDIEEISTRTSMDGINWSIPEVSEIRERGINSVRTVVLDGKIILMTTPVDGPNPDSTFYESSNGVDWVAATTIDSVPIRAIFYTLVNLNGELFAIGGTQRSNFSTTNNTV